MLNIPVLRWGKPYESLEVDEVKHFATGEPIAKVSQANGGHHRPRYADGSEGPRRPPRRFRSRS